MAFLCPNCGSNCWGTSGDEGLCQVSTLTGLGGCGLRWQRSRNMDAKLGIAAPEVVETDVGAYVMRDYPGQKLNDYLKCGTVDVKGFIKQGDLLRPAVKRNPEGKVFVFIEEPWGGAWLPDRSESPFIEYASVPEAEAIMKRAGLAAPPHGGGHGGGGGGHGGGGGMHAGGGGGGGMHMSGGHVPIGWHHGHQGTPHLRRHRFGNRTFFDWPWWWGPGYYAESSCTWIPPTDRVPPSVIAALARQPFVNGWRTVFDSGWWAEQQSPNQYFVCVVAESAVGLYGLGAASIPLSWIKEPMNLAYGDLRRQAVQQAYPTRDIGGFDIWAQDPKVEPIWQQLLAGQGISAVDAEKIRVSAQQSANAPGQALATPPAMMPAGSFPLWPMVAVGVVAVGLFVATLAIKKR